MTKMISIILTFDLLFPQKICFILGYRESMIDDVCDNITSNYEAGDQNFLRSLCEQYLLSLPIAAIVNDESFISPGGIPCEIKQLSVHEYEVEQSGIDIDLWLASLSATPSSISEYELHDFLLRNKLKFVIQSDRVPQKGYEIIGEFGRQIVICSAGNCRDQENVGAMISFNNGAITIVQQYPQDKVLDPSKQPALRDVVIRNMGEETPELMCAIAKNYDRVKAW
jgi:hypothetical protein